MMAVGNWIRMTVVASLTLALSACDIDPFGFDAKIVVEPYRLLVCEGGKYQLIAESREHEVLGCFVRRLGWNDRVILADLEDCGGPAGRSGWMVIHVKTKTIEGPIDPAQVATRPDLAGLKIVDADAAWRTLKR
jgi:hypothetical protein